jgi:ribosomal protein L37AE/L43A
MLATVQSECPLCDQEMVAETDGWRCDLCGVDFT